MNTAIIVAAGLSTRFAKNPKKNTADKLLQAVAGFPLLYYTILTFNDHPQIHQIVKKYHFHKIKKIVPGGETRAQTVAKAFQSVKNVSANDIVLIHNGANPLVTEKEISDCINACQKYGAAAVGKKMTDTIKEIHQGHIVKTHDREKLAGMQTPQGARHELFKKALAKAKKELAAHTSDTPSKSAPPTFTDDASLI